MVNYYQDLLCKIQLCSKTILIPLFFIGFLNNGFSQSCTGVLGEAIINETFGNSVLTPLEPGKTTYTFVTDHCPLDGEYILSNSLDCFGLTWHKVTEDHTPDDEKGVMAVVNASHDSGEFYSQTVPNLCSGITYEFSVWIMNLVNPMFATGCGSGMPASLDPNITMKIQRADGRSIQMLNTGSIARSNSPTWIRYSILFTMPDNGNTVVVKLINNGPGGCGNDLALDDIQFRPCNPTLQVNYDGNASSNLEVCQNSTQLIMSNLGVGYKQPVYQWQESTDSLTWKNIPNATGSSYLINADYSEKRYYRLVSAPFPNAITDQNTQCKVISNSLSITTIQSAECAGPKIHVPDSFTPNNDGSNDVLNIYHEDNVTFELQIFNRWGNVIFITDTHGYRWDGTYLEIPCAEGTYPWKINYRSVDSNKNNRNYYQTGQVVLLR
jgi:gliding motility-associated-like protein